jgi:protein-tyrosine phosphatase
MSLCLFSISLYLFVSLCVSFLPFSFPLVLTLSPLSVLSHTLCCLLNNYSGFRHASDTFHVTLGDVLNNDNFRGVLEKFCTTSHQRFYIDVIDAIVAHEALCVSESSERSNHEIFEDLVFSAKTLFDDYLTPDAKTNSAAPAAARYYKGTPHVQALGNRSSILDVHIVPLALREECSTLLANLHKESNESNRTQTDINTVRSLFSNVYKWAIDAMEKEVYPRFVQSDLFVDMMSARLHSTDVGRDNEIDDLWAWVKESNSGWVNQEGFQSVHVDVFEARDLRPGIMGSSPDAYCLVSMDSKCYRTNAISSAAPAWFESDPRASHFEFALINTTQFVELNVFDHQIMIADKHLGAVRFDIDRAIQLQRRSMNTDCSDGCVDETKHRTQESKSLTSIADEPSLADADGDGDGDGDTDDKNRPNDATAREWIDHGDGTFWLQIRKPSDPDTKAAKIRGSVRMRVSLHREPAQDCGHQPVVLDTSSLFADGIRKLVSKKKRRFVHDGFDLDLTYITDRVIAMGFPSQSFEMVYRNSMDIVKLFFNKRHPERYKVYNLCSERTYDAAHFDGRVVRYGFDDHNPCPFGMITDFCRDVHSWLSEHPQHIAAIHCKAGKGRTGLLISCYMLYTQLFPNALTALKFYAARRTKNRKGVTIPSQIRFVHYYDRYLRFERLVSRAFAAMETLNSSGANRESLASLVEPLDLGKSLTNDSDPHPSMVVQNSQVRAAAILGFRHRKMSVTERADVLDYLSMRNTAFMGGSLDSDEPTHITDEDRFHGAYFLPDEDKHYAYLSQISFNKLPQPASRDGSNMYFTVSNADLDLKTSSKQLGISPEFDQENGTLKFKIPKNMVLLFGDVQLIFYASSTLGGKTKVFQIWFNTRFMVADGSQKEFTKPEMDKANKDKKSRLVTDDFTASIAIIPKEENNKVLYSVLHSIRDKHAEFAKLLDDAKSDGNTNVFTSTPVLSRVSSKVASTSSTALGIDEEQDQDHGQQDVVQQDDAADIDEQQS